MNNLATSSSNTSITSSLSSDDDDDIRYMLNTKAKRNTKSKKIVKGYKSTKCYRTYDKIESIKGIIIIYFCKLYLKCIYIVEIVYCNT